MISYNLSSPISAIARVGKSVEGQCKHLGILTVKDLLFYVPRRYDDLSQTTAIAQARVGEKVVVTGRIELIEQKRSQYRKKLITQAIVSDDTGSLRAVWFGQPWIGKILKRGDQVYLVGEIKEDTSGMFLSSPAYDRRTSSASIHAGRIVPVYASTEKLSQKQLRFMVKLALPAIEELTDAVPPQVIQQNHLISLKEAIAWIHFPSDPQELEAARRRLKFDELFRLQLFAVSLKRELKKQAAPKVLFHETATKAFVASLPYTLTEDQRKAAWEIIQDMGAHTPMNRLLEGDVGSGKTVVVAIAALNAVLSGGQVAIMVPTEILARQHFETFTKLLALQGIKVGLLAQGSGISNKEVVKKVKEGKLDVVVGTHALIHGQYQFANLVLAVVDEQHRFGVTQRQALRGKAGDPSPREGRDRLVPHFLSLSATPIPRSLALVFYGDVDISILKEMPKGRQKIETLLVYGNQPSPQSSPMKGEEGKRIPSPLVGEGGRRPGEGGWTRERLHEFVRTEIRAGHQVFWTCPLIDVSDTLGVAAATEVFEHLKTEVFKDLKIGLLHGRMPATRSRRAQVGGSASGGKSTREEVMQDFVNKKIDILVATPVIEVGIDIPNATVMVIEGAERFGLAQLHQFRGRVGRGDAKSYCFLLVNEAEPSVSAPRTRVGASSFDMGGQSRRAPARPANMSDIDEMQSQAGLRKGSQHAYRQLGLNPSNQISRTEERLKAFLESQDGFELAEKDLELRGPGEVYGMAQAGFPEFTIASFADVEIAKMAKTAAEELLAEDPALTKYPELKQVVLEKEGKAYLE